MSSLHVAYNTQPVGLDHYNSSCMDYCYTKSKYITLTHRLARKNKEFTANILVYESHGHLDKIANNTYSAPLTLCYIVHWYILFVHN